MRFLFFFVCATLTFVKGFEDSAQQEKDASEKAFATVRGLYTTIRNIAFPGHRLTDASGIEDRFLLLMPGKVLNYYDYFPGNDYVNFIHNPDVAKKEGVVPPHVMEKWFDLADVMPTPNPMDAQDSGQSLALTYNMIVQEMKPLWLDSKTASAKGAYAQAITFLNEKVIDPDNSSTVIPRFHLYSRYRDIYNEQKLKMDDTIENKRSRLEPINYEIWFQYQYPSLVSKVESAYAGWLIYGEKEKVENYLAYVDSGSSSVMLEEARMSLRASGVLSLDRTRTIYPVSFEPSDWYQYLLPEDQGLSRDQLQVILGKISTKIYTITEMIDAVNSNSDHIIDLSSTYEATYNTLKKISNDKTATYMEKRFLCYNDTLGTGKACVEQENDKQLALDALANETYAYSDYQGMTYFNDKTKYIASLNKQKDSLQQEFQRISSLLDQSSSYLGDIIEDSNLDVPDLDASERDKEWMQFEFDSESSSEQADSEATSVTFVTKTHHSGFFSSSTTTTTHTKAATYYHDQMAKAKLKVKGELLRVTIKRPWFKPLLFKTSDLTFEQVGQNNEGRTYVAPGPELTTLQYFNILNKGKEHYLLPEYVTAFLLARNLDLEFNGLDVDTVQTTTTDMTKTHTEGHFLFFSSSSTSTKTKKTSHVQVQKTANGMKIKIPGAQIIGYYTEKASRFPQH